MTLCGVLRMDGASIRRSSLTAMLASSELGLPAVRGVHLDGSFGVVTAADAGGDPVPPIVVEEGGLVAVVLAAGSAAVRGRLRLAASAGPPPGVAGPVVAGGPDPAASDDEALARAAAAAYRSAGARGVHAVAPDRLVLVWDPVARRLLATRTGRHAVGLLVAVEGRQVAFGTESAQVRAALRAPRPLARPREPGTRVTARPTRLAGTALGAACRADGGWPVGVGPRAVAPGESVTFSAAAVRPATRAARATRLRLVPPPASDGAARR